MDKTTVELVIVGKDHEGVVAGFTNFIFQNNGNIEKINQNVVKGLFGMYLEASFTKKLDVKKFSKEAEILAKNLRMEVNIHYEVSKRKRVAVLVTKEPHCLEAILDARMKGKIKGEIVVLIGTENTLESLAKKANIPFIMINEKDQAKAEQKIISVIKKFNVDLIVLARYMRILSPNFVWRYPNRVINIHPSLLPAFPGAFAYVQAYERGAKIVGCTAHYVTEDLDQGPIIFQDAFAIDEDETLESLKKKGQKLEASTLLEAVKMHLDGRLEVYWGKVHVKPKRSR
ncbi:phosphoribosylglycinamide formyltransferase [Candidatus Nitrosotalea okcheonensis]|uniref:Formyl transferase domain protein n=1 Tax=Candidatus Nitrosotalea okcheonensis TaxID=1903276 RepID=A0A2H1FGI2_9ARCH|nr:phosphoribosylglycinamide formyltransferase [Candidatus Nitrosotalea okcheonensis]SMH71857.1 Formyl transferase domain protein [Candidatus Nitrosotalea okcheonensis]